MKKSIKNVTTENLDTALRFFELYLDLESLDIIINVVEMLEEKGDHTTLKDIYKLKAERDLK